MNIAELSLLYGNTEYVRNKLGIGSAVDFVSYIANENNVCKDKAITIIKGNAHLMRLMFAVA